MKASKTTTDRSDSEGQLDKQVIPPTKYEHIREGQYYEHRSFKMLGKVVLTAWGDISLKTDDGLFTWSGDWNVFLKHWKYLFTKPQ